MSLDYSCSYEDIPVHELLWIPVSRLSYETESSTLSSYVAGDPYADLVESLLGDDNATIGLQDVLTLHNRSRTDFMVASELIHSSDE